jgi:hypothetical protein
LETYKVNSWSRSFVLEVHLGTTTYRRVSWVVGSVSQKKKGGASEGRRRKFFLISSIELKKKVGRNKGNTGYFIAYGILYGLPLWNSTYFFTVLWVGSEKKVESTLLITRPLRTYIHNLLSTPRLCTRHPVKPTAATPDNKHLVALTDILFTCRSLCGPVEIRTCAACPLMGISNCQS